MMLDWDLSPMMLDWDLYIQFVSIFFTSAVGVYCFRLSKFFQNGVFYKSFRLLAPAFVVYAFGSFVDILPHLGLVPDYFHAVHFLSYTVSFVLIVYSIYLFYQAWRTMGMGLV